MPDRTKDAMLGIFSQPGGHFPGRVDGHGEETTGLNVSCSTHGALPHLLPRLLCHHLAQHITHRQLLSHSRDCQRVNVSCAEKVVGLLDRGGGRGEGRTGRW